MAAQSELHFFSNTASLLTFLCSGWRVGITPAETTRRPNARRIPASQQNPVLAEPSGGRHRYERATIGSLFAVRSIAAAFCVAISQSSCQVSELARCTSYPDEEGHRLRRILGRGKRDRCEGRPAQLQVGWGTQDQGMLSVYSRIKSRR